MEAEEAAGKGTSRLGLLPPSLLVGKAAHMCIYWKMVSQAFRNMLHEAGDRTYNVPLCEKQFPGVRQRIFNVIHSACLLVK